MPVVQHPLTIDIPAGGVLAAESIHAERFEMQWARDDYHEILYVLKGRVELHEPSRAEPWLLREGELAAVAPARPPRLADRETATMLLLCFSTAFVRRDAALESLWSRLAHRDPRILTPDPELRARLELAWRRMLAEQTQPRPGSEIAVQAEALDCLVRLARMPRHSHTDPALRRVQRVVESIGERFYEPWDLDSAARRAHMSRRLFSQRFREITGTTFLAHLTELRLAHAARLLQSGGNTIAGAAFSSGFGDLAHFYRVFRSRYGVPPGQWQKSPTPPPNPNNPFSRSYS